MTIFLNKLKKNHILIVLLVIFILVICKSKLVITTVRDASSIYLNNVFPCMFIFYTLGDLLINYNIYKAFNTTFGKILSKIFKLSSNGLLLVFLSMLLGFPSGSKYICYFLDKDYIDYNLADKLLYVTHFSNPIFILGTISILTNMKIALIVLISHYGSNILLILMIKNKFTNINTKYSSNSKELIEVLNESFINTFKIILIVLFNTIIFITLSTLINSLYKNKIFNLIIFMIFDITNGIISITNINLSLFIKGLLITILLTFGGINIHFQVKSIVKNKKLPYSSFIKGRFIVTLLSIIIYILLFNVLKVRL